MILGFSDYIVSYGYLNRTEIKTDNNTIPMIGIRHVIRSNRVDWVNNESTVTPALKL